MLSLQQCRSLLGTDCNLTDAQVEQLRQELYALSEVAIGALQNQKLGPKSNSSGDPEICPMLSQIPDCERAQFEERAAILEYQGKLTRPEAERQAFGEWVQSKKLATTPLKRHRTKRRRRRLTKGS